MQVALRLLRPNMPEPGPQFPRALQTLVQDCWAQDPKERPTSAEVVVRLQELLKVCVCVCRIHACTRLLIFRPYQNVPYKRKTRATFKYRHAYIRHLIG